MTSNGDIVGIHHLALVIETSHPARDTQIALLQIGFASDEISQRDQIIEADIEIRHGEVIGVGSPNDTLPPRDSVENALSQTRLVGGDQIEDGCIVLLGKNYSLLLQATDIGGIGSRQRRIAERNDHNLNGFRHLIDHRDGTLEMNRQLAPDNCGRSQPQTPSMLLLFRHGRGVSDSGSHSYCRAIPIGASAQNPSPADFVAPHRIWVRMPGGVVIHDGPVVTVVNQAGIDIRDFKMILLGEVTDRLVHRLLVFDPGEQVWDQFSSHGSGDTVQHFCRRYPM